MTSQFENVLPQVRHLFLVLLLLCLSGCGKVDWFPEYHREPTTPDQFSFPTKTGVEVNAAVTSDPITVSGLTAATSPISVSGPNDSKYAVNEGSATSAPGTVKNGDRVTVTHTSTANAGQSVTSTLSIGNISGTFTSVTRFVATPVFSPTGPVPPFVQAVSGTISASDTVLHVVTIKDSINSGNAFFAVVEPGGVLVFTISTQTALSGRQIYVRNLASNVAAGVKTTLVIDGIEYEVPLK